MQNPTPAPEPELPLRRNREAPGPTHERELVDSVCRELTRRGHDAASVGLWKWHRALINSEAHAYKYLKLAKAGKPPQNPHTVSNSRETAQKTAEHYYNVVAAKGGNATEAVLRYTKSRIEAFLRENHPEVYQTPPKRDATQALPGPAAKRSRTPTPPERDAAQALPGPAAKRSRTPTPPESEVSDDDDELVIDEDFEAPAREPGESWFPKHGRR
jgi:hypothetical protein